MPGNRDSDFSLVTTIAQSSRHRRRTAQQKLYKYDPLQSTQHIRLLELLPGVGDTWLRCRLVQVDLNTDPSYEAISYAWGDPDIQNSVLCDGKFINITCNLFDALCVFRLPKTSRYLWADAMCINQQDKQERRAQVRLMGRIYSKASEVLFWVGNENSEMAERLFDFLIEHVTPNYERSLQVRRTRGLPEYEAGDWNEICKGLRSTSQESDPLVLDRDITIALNRLLSAPVMSRGWIIQEFSLACSLSMCWGTSHANAKWIVIAIMILIDTSGGKFVPDWIGARTLLTLITAHSPASHSYSFLSNLYRTRNSKFSDERDRVYGLLALPSWECESGELFVQPDYEVDDSEVSLRVTERLLIQHSDLDVLTCIDHRGDFMESRPSWVPDWRKWDWYRNELRIESGFTAISRHEFGTNPCISIRGIRVDTIATIRGGRYAGSTMGDIQALLRDVQVEEDPECTAYLATLGHSIAELYLTDAYDRADKDEVQTRAYQAFMNHDHAEPLTGVCSIQYEDTPSDLVLASLFWTLLQLAEAKKFFSSKKGKLGIGPAIVREGDVLVVLFGRESIQFLLRPVGHLWRFVGPCYVHKFRDGKVIDRWKESGEPAEDFMIY